jgi:ATP/maltotriose-dependent transcriptional regulator MalT
MHQYLDGLIDEALSAELFDVVAQRTEGWPVGLRLVSLALKGKGNQADVVQAIRSAHRYITEYLKRQFPQNGSL